VGIAVAAWIVSVIFLLFVPVIYALPYMIYRIVKTGAPSPEALASDKMLIFFSVAAILPTHLLTFVLVWAIVSYAGVIGFVGLVAPHIGRLVVGGDHRILLPFSALVGALLLLLADMAGRMLFAPVVVPAGIVVAYLGVPIFLHLLLGRRRQGA